MIEVTLTGVLCRDPAVDPRQPAGVHAIWLSCGERMTLGHKKCGVLAYILADEELMRYREGDKVVVHGELHHAREAVPSHCPDPYIVVVADSIRYAIDPRLPAAEGEQSRAVH
jgi:hypothetical protein